MIGPIPSKYRLYTQPTDMRKGFYGLAGIVNNNFKAKLQSGDGFVFINKRRTLMKILIWQPTGFVIIYKKLERGTFELPETQVAIVSIDHTKLIMILEGIMMKSIRMRKRLK